MAEYEADRHAVREKTARLRALRLARDAANNQTPILPAKKHSAGAGPSDASVCVRAGLC